MPQKRPFGVTLLLWMVLSLSAWGVTRVVAALETWDVLREFNASLSPLYLSTTGAGWSVTGGILLYSIWRGRSWARPAFVTSIFIWLIEYWLEQIFFQSPRANQPFALACSITVLIILLLVTTLQGTKSYFIKK